MWTGHNCSCPLPFGHCELSAASGAELGRYVFFVPPQESAKREVVARAPTRIDFGGGWTDVPPYCDREGGLVCNVAITRYATTRVRSSSNGDGVSLTPDEPLLRAAAKRTGLKEVVVKLSTDFPQGAGLDGSSAASAAVLGAVARWQGRDIQRVDIAEEGRRIEVEELGIAGGRQDHYAATHGGALGLTFTKKVRVDRIDLSNESVKSLRSQCLLIYTGESRVSGETIRAVLGAYERGEQRVVQSLARMREIAMQMAESLRLGQMEDLGRLLGEHWTHQRSLHPTIPTARIDEIVAVAANAGALGAKAMGASGGGCVLVMATRDRIAPVRAAIAPLGTFIDFEIDQSGLSVD